MQTVYLRGPGTASCIGIPRRVHLVKHFLPPVKSRPRNRVNTGNRCTRISAKKERERKKHTRHLYYYRLMINRSGGHKKPIFSTNTHLYEKHLIRGPVLARRSTSVFDNFQQLFLRERFHVQLGGGGFLLLLTTSATIILILGNFFIKVSRRGPRDRSGNERLLRLTRLSLC